MVDSEGNVLLGWCAKKMLEQREHGCLKVIVLRKMTWKKAVGNC